MANDVDNAESAANRGQNNFRGGAGRPQQPRPGYQRVTDMYGNPIGGTGEAYTPLERPAYGHPHQVCGYNT